MATLQTVRGPIDTAEMGPTLMHEHIFVVTPEVQANLPRPWDKEARIEDAVAKLSVLVDLGVRTVVDPTVIGLGRDISLIQRVNDRVDITSSPPPASTPTTRCRSTSASGSHHQEGSTRWSNCWCTT